MLAFSFAGLYLSGWKPLKIQGIGGGHEYGDLASVLHAATCYKTIGSEVFTVQDNCSYQYGLFLLKFINFFHLNSLSAFTLGGIFFVSVSIMLALLGAFTASNRSGATLNFLILISPGAWLLFERGNFDLLIFIFLVIMVFTLNTKLSLVGAVLLISTTMMKFYTIPLVILYILVEKNRTLRVLAVISLSIATPFILSNMFSGPGYPNPMYVAFGLPLPGLWVNFFSWRFDLGFVLGMAPLYVIGFATFAITFISYKFSKVTESLRALESRINFSSENERNIFLFSSLTYLSCFLAGSNFDYRLIYLTISLVLLNKSIPSLTKSKTIIFVELSALWFTYFYFGAIGAIPVFISIAGNASQLFLAVFLFSYMYRFILDGAKSLIKRSS
jgi:hypothetical protein